jgi:acyl-CoA oxidase
MSMVDLSFTVKSGVQFSLWGGSVLNLGTERHRRQFFDGIASLRLPGCFAMTELKHGSNVAALQTEAVLDVERDEWVIHTPDEGAIKWWIGNAAEDGLMATVFARLKVPSSSAAAAAPPPSAAASSSSPSTPAYVDHGVHAFVVPLRDPATHLLLPGVEIHDCGYKVGLNGVDNGAIRFTRVRVPRTNLLDRFASVDRSGRYSSPLPSEGKRFGATLGELTGGRVGLCSASVGVLKGAATIAVRYCAGRQQFGPPGGAAEVAVLDYQSLQQRLMPIVASAYVYSFARDALVKKYAEAKKTRQPAAVEEVHALSAGLKAQVTSFTATALSTCREACGGHGYAAVNRLGALRSDHDIFQTFEGDNTVLLQQVAATLLKGYREQFKGSPVASSAQYLAQYLGGYVLPHNPLVTHEVSERHLRSPSFLRAALRHRTARLLFTLARRMRAQRARHGGSHFAAWNACLNHILALANAHVDSVCFDAASEAAERCGDRDCRRALKSCAELFALRAIAADPLFRNDEYVAPAKAKAISRLIVRLCAELRGVALPLVDAWAIPDFILRAPIGLSHAAGGVSAATGSLAALGARPVGGGVSGSSGSGVGATGGPGGAGDMYREYLDAVGFGPDGDVADGSNVPGVSGGGGAAASGAAPQQEHA